MRAKKLAEEAVGAVEWLLGRMLLAHIQRGLELAHTHRVFRVAILLLPPRERVLESPEDGALALLTVEEITVRKGVRAEKEKHEGD